MYRPHRRYLPRDFREWTGIAPTIVVPQVHPGTCCHIGLQSAVNKLTPNALQEEPTTVGVQLHTDGSHPFGSSKTRVGTVLGRVTYPFKSAFRGGCILRAKTSHRRRRIFREPDARFGEGSTELNQTEEI
ncbi:hypothetical protein FGIG_10814 [Fasciola gigantica]|uniref:Uncharacterized protein n=1 Tax=Fasciola gigantica TaxID=46835 RepID=A0A504YIF9_FASGI|nr:hypothetical protein FGIG_10814 [Fasciola gigantica]